MKRRNVVFTLAALPFAAQAKSRHRDRNAGLKSLLDTLAGGDKAQVSLDALNAFSPRGLSAGAALDYRIIHKGLTRDADIACRFPEKQGDGYYAAALARQVGQDITPADAHAKLSAVLDTLLARANHCLVAQGLTTGSVGDRFKALARDRRWLYSDDDIGRDKAVADMNAWLASSRARLPRAFSNLPPQCLTVGVRRMSQADEAAAKSGYRVLPAGDTPGAYFVDLHDIRRRPSWSLPSVVHHETLPGHMIQLPIEASAAPHPLRLTYASGFGEGWAIYAEQLSDEQGAFATDPLAKLGYLQWMLFRAGRALADIGIHWQNWSDDQARSHLDSWQGDPVIFAPFERELDRIHQTPGARAAEALNWLGMVELRDKAVRAGRSLAAFHQALLAHGAVSLELVPGIL